MADNKDTSKNKTIKYACRLNVADIMGALHKVALENAKKIDKNYEIQNTAFDDDGNLITAGKHLIVVLPIAGKPDKEISKKILAEYVHNFSGPDIQVTDDNIYELINQEQRDKEHEQEVSGGLKESNAHKKDKKLVKEEAARFATIADEGRHAKTFAQYLTTEAKDKQPLGGSENVGNIGDVKGYYTTYSLEIEGVKESTLADALKKFAKNFFDDLGISNNDWMNGSTGERHTISSLKDELHDVFGKIDSNELVQHVQEETKERYQQSSPTVSVFDQKTIMQHLKAKFTQDDFRLFKKAERSLCIKVKHDSLHDEKYSGRTQQVSSNDGDKSQMLYNKQEIANIVNNAIKGLFKKFKNRIKASDVIFINDYDGGYRRKDVDSKIEAHAAKNESILEKCFKDAFIVAAKTPSKPNSRYRILKMLFEDYVTEDTEKMSLEELTDIIQKKFQEIAEKEFKDKLNDEFDFKLKTSIVSAEEAKKLLSDKASEIKDGYDFNFVIQIEYPAKSGHKNAEADNNSIIKAAAQAAFDKAENIEELDTAIARVDSAENAMLYESKRLLNEKSNSKAERTNITPEQIRELKNAIKAKTLDQIRKNQEQIVKKWTEEKGGQTGFDFMKKYGKQYQEFKRLVFDTTEDNLAEIFKYIDSASKLDKKTENGKKTKIVLTRFLPAIKQLEDPPKDKAIVQFYAEIDNNEEIPLKKVEISEIDSVTEEDLKYPLNDTLNDFAEKHDCKKTSEYTFEPPAKELVKNLKPGVNKVLIKFISNDDNPDSKNDKPYKVFIKQFKLSMKNDNTNVKKKLGVYDFYIIPMPGLTTKKYKSHKTKSGKSDSSSDI